MSRAAAASTVVVTSRSFGSGRVDLEAELRGAGYDVVRAETNHDLASLEGPLALATAWIAGTAPITAEHLELAPHLRVISRYGVGTDAVDLAAAVRRGVVVTNTPGANSDAVADHALALTLAAIRGVVDGDRRVRQGDWTTRRGRELNALTVGIVGFGRIGRGLAARLEGCGARIVVHDPYVADADVVSLGHAPAALHDLARAADLVSLHLPGGACIVDAVFLAAMGPGGVVVNTARADLVDEEAVAAALGSGHLSAFAADTLATEGRADSSPLLDERLADRVVLTPHLGAQTLEAIDRMGVAAVENVLAVLEGRQPSHLVTQEGPS